MTTIGNSSHGSVEEIWLWRFPHLHVHVYICEQAKQNWSAGCYSLTPVPGVAVFA